MQQESFKNRCYQLLRKVPAGKVVTYKSLAEALGSKAYRAVGTAMATNPDVPATPCHRVVKSDGSVGQYAYGVEQKVALLASEGVVVNEGKVELETYLFDLTTLQCTDR